jgi:hypothetical protein
MDELGGWMPSPGMVRGKLGPYRVGLREAKVGVAGEGLPEVVTGLVHVSLGTVDAGEAVVRPGFLVEGLGFGGNDKGGIVV